MHCLNHFPDTRKIKDKNPQGLKLQNCNEFLDLICINNCHILHYKTKVHNCKLCTSGGQASGKFVGKLCTRSAQACT